MSKLDKTEVLAAFEKAYEAANGKKPEITAKSGWYSVDGGKNVRLADLVTLAEELSSGAAPAAKEEAPAKPAAKKAPAKKAATKKAAPVTATKEKEYTVTKPNPEGFTAEEFWIKELAEREHDTRLPRGVV
ncbi:hypothetical protein [Pseudoalteromonas spongiae]|uniref:hypothetical protein n=1 Tax=Pseudoalteromonas spongiae TaxID=298657 RepID=UPI00373626BB